MPAERKEYLGGTMRATIIEICKKMDRDLARYSLLARNAQRGATPLRLCYNEYFTEHKGKQRPSFDTIRRWYANEA